MKLDERIYKREFKGNCAEKEPRAVWHPSLHLGGKGRSVGLSFAATCSSLDVRVTIRRARNLAVAKNGKTFGA